MLSRSFCFCAGVALCLVACGGDGASSPDSEDPQSSSSLSSSDSGASSSGTAGSSSSAAEDPADSTRAAVWADLLPVMDLGDELGLPVRYIVAENGVFSKVFLKDDEPAGMLVGLAVLEGDGTLRADSTRSAGIALAAGLTNEKIYADLVRAPVRIFRVHKSSGKLYAGTSRADLRPVVAATLDTWSEALVSGTSEVQGLHTLVNSDTTMTYRLYDDGAYVRTGSMRDSVWEVGFYAVQNQYLILIPFAYDFDPAKDQLSKVGVIRVSRTGNTWAYFSGLEQKYAKSSLESSLSASALFRSWHSQSASRFWSLRLNDGLVDLKVESATGSQLFRQKGLARLFGNFLLLDFKSAPSNCSGDGDAFKSCFNFILGEADAGSDLQFLQGDIPTVWEEK